MKAPEPPDTCCGSGCAHCVWDTYEEQWDEYKERKEELKAELKRRGWPIPKEAKGDETMAQMDSSLKALRDMERRLAEEQEKLEGTATSAV